ncbi:tubulin binding cofactor A [Cladochytrium replicatum]|nr:tubulin binding cofactor A [Cladochytrium replicatum]
MSIRELKIKTGVVNRTYKELLSYRKEAVTQQHRIDSLIEKGEDFHTIRKQKEVLEETNQMIPDNQQRLAKARQELTELLQNLEAKADVSILESEEYDAAKKVLDLVESH